MALIINLILGFSGDCKSALNLKASTPQFKNWNKKTATKATCTWADKNKYHNSFKLG